MNQTSLSIDTLQTYFLQKINNLCTTNVDCINQDPEGFLINGLTTLKILAELSKESKLHSPFLRNFLLPKDAWTYDVDNIYNNLTHRGSLNTPWVTNHLYMFTDNPEKHLVNEIQDDGEKFKNLHVPTILENIASAVQKFFDAVRYEEGFVTLMMMMARVQISPLSQGTKKVCK